MTTTRRPHKPSVDIPVSTPFVRPPLCIVVADNRETADALHDYLSKAGIPTRTSRRLRDVSALCKDASTLVLFPDEYADADVRASLLGLRAVYPHLLLLLVTAMPQRLRALCDPDVRSVLPVILPKPVFGWNLLDAIREHAAREQT